ncbi:MAG: ATP-binding cassette domain-containing protein [Firmicutes bacterium]|nr:ATP-binding cassette domain-containing protein [Bacillota bacterium]
MDNCLEVKQIYKSYGNKPIVKNISFSAPAGQILGLLGPNGAGKTTTLRMIMGITAPDQGEIIFKTADGQNNTIPRHLVGYLPEERGLYKEAKVLQILMFLAGLKNLDKATAKQRALHWLEKFDLQNYAYAKVEQLSKGMAQKVQFIASIIHEPKFIVLDEPFSGLDPVNQELFKNEIRALAACGSVILLSSHQMNIVEELCDRIFLIHQGEEVVFGTLNEIKQQYGNYRVFLDTAQNITGLAELAVVAAVEQIQAEKWVIDLKEQVTPEQFLAVLPKEIKIEALSIIRPSLHDIFVRIAKGGLEDETNMEDR